MNELKNQENNPQIQKLHRILNEIPKEEKPDVGWQVIENDLFLAMDEFNKNSTLNNKYSFIQLIFRYFASNNTKIKTIGAFSVLTILVFTVYLTIFFQTTPIPLVNSKIVGVSGTVQISEIQDNHDNQVLFISENETTNQRIEKNQTFETKNNSSLIAQLDRASNIFLSENTRLTIIQANSKHIVLYLHKGSILASINKRSRHQTFSIVTSEVACKVVGTIFKVSVFPHNNINSTNLSVIEGKVDIRDIENPEKMKSITSGESVVIEHGLFEEVRRIPEDSIPYHEISLLSLTNKIINDTLKRQGIINIKSDPANAKIYIGDDFIGVTPHAINFPSGSYNVSIEKDGFKPWKKNIYLETMYSANVSAKLSQYTQNQYIKVTKPLIKKSRKVIRKKSKLVNKKTHVNPLKEEIVIDTSVQDTKDFGFILNPEFVKALIHMTAGEYQEALIILDSLKEIPTISITEKIRIMSKISACYKGLGNFENTLLNLTEKYNSTGDSLEKSNYLWEMITVKANCLEDYSGAEKDIITYIRDYPNGTWIESAYTKLGEIQYITGKYIKAVGTFQYHINYFKNDPNIENSIYTIANIMRSDIKDCKMAIKWYSRLLEEHKLSSYYANALFERAECYEKISNNGKSRNDYQKYLELYPEGHLKNLCLSRLSKMEIKDK
ncbi:MAG: PEGA domain-containing protein [Chitinispirillia bacterium]|jgi:tetratricopeptide (TPR) repeat protein